MDCKFASITINSNVSGSPYQWGYEGTVNKNAT